MVRTRYNGAWPRRGFSLLWDTELLAGITAPGDVLSLRQFFAQLPAWPDELPAAYGDAMVVSGVEGCLDILDALDAEHWIETDLRQAVLSFQQYYQGQAGLILWMPSGRKRISMNAATERYFWKHRASGPEGLPIGRLLFSGAENEVERIMNTEDAGADYDGKEWSGLHHPRIS